MKALVFLVSTLLFLGSCGPKPRPRPANSVQNQEQSLLEWNQEVLENEIRTIERYLKTKELDYISTETGLYIFNEEMGSGARVDAGDKVWIYYSVELLDGTLCFQTDSLLPESFIIGRNRKPAGLNEGVKRMQEGGRVNLIVPHYLLHGIAGDRENIPPITPALFKVSLLKVEKR